MTIKIVVNRCNRGFRISDAAIEHMLNSGMSPNSYSSLNAIPRDNKYLVNAVEMLGSKLAGFYAQLEVVEIPDGVDWYIDELDGYETIREVQRSW